MLVGSLIRKPLVLGFKIFEIKELIAIFQNVGTSRFDSLIFSEFLKNWLWVLKKLKNWWFW
jgi:hypothetical protein